MTSRTRSLQVGSSKVVLVGTIQGLAGEARHVQQAWDSFAPEGASAIALGRHPFQPRPAPRRGKEREEAAVAAKDG